MIEVQSLLAMVAGILAIGCAISAFHWRKDKKENP
jgi:hypothetical protein